MAASIEETPLGLTWVLDEPLRRASHALVDAGRVWLVDPTDQVEAMERVIGLGQPTAVLQLLDRHNRDCVAVAARLGVPHLKVPADLAGTPFAVLEVLRLRYWREVALWWQASRALVVAEAIGTSAGYAPGPSGAGVSIALRPWPPRRLAAFEPLHLLVGHGHPLHGPQVEFAVKEAIARSRRDLPRALSVSARMTAQLLRAKARQSRA